MEVIIYSRTVVYQNMIYSLKKEDIFQIQDAIENEEIFDEETLLEYLEDNFEVEISNTYTDDYEVHGYDDNLLGQIKKYKK